nr:MAG TPA: hypothetical protein [Caudoviricetes sp.]
MDSDHPVLNQNGSKSCFTVLISRHISPVLTSPRSKVRLILS